MGGCVVVCVGVWVWGCVGVGVWVGVWVGWWCMCVVYVCVGRADASVGLKQYLIEYARISWLRVRTMLHGQTCRDAGR